MIDTCKNSVSLEYPSNHSHMEAGNADITHTCVQSNQWKRFAKEAWRLSARRAFRDRHFPVADGGAEEDDLLGAALGAAATEGDFVVGVLLAARVEETLELEAGTGSSFTGDGVALSPPVKAGAGPGAAKVPKGSQMLGNLTLLYSPGMETRFSGAGALFPFPVIST